MTRIALNGLGRIGKLVLRDLIDSGSGDEIVLLNDPVFVEAAKALAQRLLQKGEATDTERLAAIFSLALTRKPTKQEEAVLLEHLAEQRKRYEADEKAALDLLSTGAKPVDGSIKPSELAAWTSVSRAMLNLYETTARF